MAAKTMIPSGPDQVAPGCRNQRVDPEEEVSEGERRGKNDDSLPKPGSSPPPLDGGPGIGTPQTDPPSIALGTLARAVRPPFVRSPTLQVTSHPWGMKRSTRDPNRMMPIRLPWGTRSPFSGSVTILRATRPAICRTMIRWGPAAIPRVACSLSSLALGFHATANPPGL